MNPALRTLAALSRSRVAPALCALLLSACGGGGSEGYIGRPLDALGKSFTIGAASEVTVAAGGTARATLALTCVFNSNSITVTATNADALANSQILVAVRRAERCDQFNGARNGAGEALYEDTLDWPVTVLDSAAPGRYGVELFAEVIGEGISNTERTSLVVNVTPAAEGGFRLDTPADVRVRSVTPPNLPARPRAELPVAVQRIGHGGAIALRWSAIDGAGQAIPITRLAIDAPAELRDTVTTANAIVDYDFQARPQPGDRVIVTAAGGGVSRSQAVRLRADSVAPPTPAGFTAAGSYTSIALAWQLDRAATEYRLERGDADNGPFAPLVTLPATATSHVDAGLPANTRFVYRLIAANAEGSSVPAAAAAVTREELALSVTVHGNGRVASEPPGIDCGSDCSQVYALNAQVRLVATPAAGQSAGRFSGDADCSDGIVTIDRPIACTVTFVPLPGSGWQPLGAPLTDRSSVAPAFSLAIDDDTFGNPAVAYVEAAAPGEPARLYVKRLDGIVWTLLGTGALNAGSTTAASDPSLATRLRTPMHVAWSQGNGTQQNVYVARFNGSVWESVGPPGVPLNVVAGSRAVRPSLAFDFNGLPLLAWIENGAVKFKRYDGNAWVASSIGGEGPASADADRVQLSAGSHSPVIAWTEGPVNDRRLKVTGGYGFAPFSPQVNAPFDVPVTITHFGVRAEDDGAAVAWTQDERPYTVHMRRWGGLSWDAQTAPPVNVDPALRLLSFAVSRGTADLAFSLQPPATAPFVSAFQASGGSWFANPSLVTPGVPLAGIQIERAEPNAPVVAGHFVNAAGRHELRVYRHFP